MSEEQTQESIVDDGIVTEEELKALEAELPKAGEQPEENNTESEVEESVEEKEEVTDEITEDQPEDVNLILKETPFKDEKSLIDAYKNLQGEYTRLTQQQKQELSEPEEVYEEVYEEEDILNEDEADEFVSKKEMLEAMKEYTAKERERLYSEISQAEQKENDQRIIREAQKSKTFENNKGAIVGLLQKNAQYADNAPVDNILLLGDTIVKEGLQDIYDKRPDLFLTNGGGLELARLMKGVPETVKKAKEQQTQVDSINATVANSQVTTNTKPIKSDSEKSVLELAREVGDKEVIAELTGRGRENLI